MVLKTEHRCEDICFEKPGAKTGTSAVRGIIKSKKAMRIEMPSLIFVHKK